MGGLIFSTSFTDASNARRALAFNLLGAVGGALLEYLSDYFGVNSLVLVATLLYFFAWYFLVEFSNQRSQFGDMNAPYKEISKNSKVTKRSFGTAILYLHTIL